MWNEETRDDPHSSQDFLFLFLALSCLHDAVRCSPRFQNVHRMLNWVRIHCHILYGIVSWSCYVCQEHVLPSVSWKFIYMDSSHIGVPFAPCYRHSTRNKFNKLLLADKTVSSHVTRGGKWLVAFFAYFCGSLSLFLPIAPTFQMFPHVCRSWVSSATFWADLCSFFPFAWPSHVLLQFQSTTEWGSAPLTDHIFGSCLLPAIMLFMDLEIVVVWVDFATRITLRLG